SSTTSGGRASRLAKTLFILRRPKTFLQKKIPATANRSSLTNRNRSPLCGLFHARIWATSARPRRLRIVSLEVPALLQTPWYFFNGRTTRNRGCPHWLAGGSPGRGGN